MPPRYGPVETALRSDLKAFPEEMRKGGIAAGAILLARQLDQLDIAPMAARDVAGYTREIRLALVTLREQAPGTAEGDKTDDKREARERRLRIVGDGDRE